MMYIFLALFVYLTSAYGVWRWVRTSMKPNHVRYGCDPGFGEFAGTVFPVYNTVIFLLTLLVDAKTGLSIDSDRFYRKFFKLHD